MLKTYLIIAIRNFLKNKTTTIITIGGFALSLAVTILLSSYILEELSVNKHLKNLENIYQVVTTDNSAGIEEVDKKVIKNIPGIEKVSYYSNFGKTPFTIKNKTMSAYTVMCEEEFFDIFSVQLLIGNPNEIFNDRNNIIISESFAQKFFDNEDPIGKTVKISHDKEFIIGGIFKDLPERGSIKADIFCHTESKISSQTAIMNGIRTDYSRLFILLNPRSDIKKIETYLSNELVKIRREPKASCEYHLHPFRESYFNEPFRNDHLLHANIDLILLIGGVTFIVLLLSILNYTNLTLASNFSRWKEFGIKKANGAGKVEIFRQIITESFFEIFVSVVLGFVLIEILNPLFKPLLGRIVEYNILFARYDYTLIFVSFILFLTLLSGFYPAYKAGKVKPVTLMKYNTSSREGFVLRGVLNTIQFTFSSILIISLLFIYLQTDYLKTKDLGFDSDELLKIDVHGGIGERAKVIKEKLLKNPGIKNVTLTNGVPGQTYSWFGSNDISSVSLSTDEDFLKTFSISLVEGRFFEIDEKDVCVINESALKEFGFKDWRHEEIQGCKVIGIIKDFNHQNLYKESGPVTVFPIDNRVEYFPGEYSEPRLIVSNIILKMEPQNIHKTINSIATVWSEVIPDFQLNYSFYDEWLDSLYKKEQQNVSVIKIFTAIAISIALLGLFGITELSSKKKVKEIGIRKVFGAKVSQIVLILNKGFLQWVLLAFIIACPLSYYIVNKWLDRYPYKIEVSWYIFALAGIVILFLAFISISFRVFKAATANPVEALRYE